MAAALPGLRPGIHPIAPVQRQPEYQVSTRAGDGRHGVAQRGLAGKHRRSAAGLQHASQLHLCISRRETLLRLLRLADGRVCLQHPGDRLKPVWHEPFAGKIPSLLCGDPGNPLNPGADICQKGAGFRCRDPAFWPGRSVPARFRFSK